ncbi:MAG: TonB-dependent receptor [Ideonella sp.]|nr:TonB-dependent receptor [Ideonella sp.]
MSVLTKARSLALAAACAVSSLLLVATAPAVAQPDPAPQLDPVIVTATGYAQPLTDTIAHSTVLTREDIERSQAIDLPTLLAREAGLQLARNGGRGSATTLFLRGAPASQVLLLVDGVPQTREDATGSLGVEHLMLDQVERVEIVRGNVSAVYGSGAIGGVIQVFTKRGQGSPGGDIAAEGGSYGFGRVAANAAGQWGPTRASIGVSGQQSSGFSAQDASANPAVNPDRDGYRNTSGSASLGYEFERGHTLGLALTQTAGNLDYDSAFASAVDTQTSRTKISTVRLASSNQFTNDWLSTLALGWQRDDSSFVESGAFGTSSQYISGNQSLNWSNRVALAPQWNLNAGLDLQRQTIDTDDGFGGVYSESRNIDAFFAGVQGNAGAASVQFNLRYDDIGGIGGQPTGYLGLGWQLAPQWKVTASASTAFNAPPLGYLHAPYFGNPDLEPEKARSGELGLQYAAGNQLLRAIAFTSRVRNEFQYDFASNRFENIASSDNRGLEVTYEGVLGKTELGASLTRQDPTNADTGERLLRRAATLASASIWQPIGAWRIGAQWAYVGPRSDAGGVSLAGYSLVDLLAHWDLGHGAQLFGRIENLFNADYESVAGYNTASLSGFIGLRWKFQ